MYNSLNDWFWNDSPYVFLEVPPKKKAFNTKQYNAHVIDKTNLHIIHGRRYFIDRQYSLFLGQNICVIVYFHIHMGFIMLKY